MSQPLRPTSVSLDPGVQRTAAVDLFNYTWTLLEKPDRTPRETDLMIDAAHASRFFWETIGEPVNHARGEWQISHVYAVIDRPVAALHHARRCLEICEEHNIGDFDLAYAYEALARAHRVTGDEEAATRYLGLAQEAGEEIADREDREHFMDDLAELT
jgi:hypothetical protein